MMCQMDTVRRIIQCQMLLFLAQKQQRTKMVLVMLVVKMLFGYAALVAVVGVVADALAEL